MLRLKPLARRRPRTATATFRLVLQQQHGPPTGIRIGKGLSPSRFANFSTLSTKEDHNRRVAELQERIRQQQQQQQQQEQLEGGSPIQETKTETETVKFIPNTTMKKQAEKRPQSRHVMVTTIQHWLTKDSSFLASTMKALNVKTNQQEHSSNDHIDNIAWNQYRKLYQASIPSFRESLESNLKELQLEDAFSQLEQVGFKDPAWSKTFRQYRGHLVHQEEMGKNVEKIKIEHDQLKEAVQTAKEELQDMKLQLKELEQEMEKQLEQDLITHIPIKEMPAWQQQKNDVTSDTRNPPPSLFSRVFESVASLLASSSSSSSTTTTPENQKQDEVPSAAGVPPRSFTQKRQLGSRQRASLQKRIIRKSYTTDRTQGQADAAKMKLQKVQDDLKRSSPPLPADEYERANQVVQNVRDDICRALAHHIQQQHKQLIDQYQALDSKTGKYKYCLHMLETKKRDKQKALAATQLSRSPHRFPTC